MVKVILTYIDGIKHELECLEGTEVSVKNELEEEFVIEYNGKEHKVNKEHFTAYGKYRGKECLVVVFRKNNECIIIVNNREKRVNRKDITI